MALLVLMASSVSAVIVTNSPTNCTGTWTTCQNAFANDANRATSVPGGTVNKTGYWKLYNFSIPASASIDKVVVRADYLASNVRGVINVRVSTDGGLTSGSNHIFKPSTSEKTYNIDVTSDFSWTSSMLSGSNLVINVTCYENGTGSDPTCRLDWVPVNVTYTPFDFTVAVKPTAQSVVQGAAAQTTVNVTKTGGVAQTVSLSVSGCPTDATCNLNQSSGLPSYLAVLDVQTAGTTPAGSYLVTVNGTGDGLARSATFNVTVTGIPDSCSDSDGGFVTGTQGTAVGNKSGSPYSKTDFCTNSTHLVEYYCSGVNAFNFTSSCGSGCDAGRCLSSSIAITVFDPAVNGTQYSANSAYNTTIQLACSGDVGAVCANVYANVSVVSWMQTLPNNDGVHSLGTLNVGDSVNTTWTVQTNSTLGLTNNTYDAGADYYSAQRQKVYIEII